MANWSKAGATLATLVVVAACSKQDGPPPLPDQPPRWVESVPVSGPAAATHVGATSAILGATTVKKVAVPATIKLGDTIDGVNIGAIKCVFFEKDSSYGGEQFMFRGKWGCQAGRSREEVETAVQDNGDKLHDYIYLSPVTLESGG